MNFSREFSQVEYFFLISFVLIYLIYFYRVMRAARKLKLSANSLFFKLIIRGVYLGLIFLALLGPNFGVTETEARASGKDIFLVFDLSESMNSNDVEPTRLDMAKSEALKLIDRFGADRLGVIVFNSDASVYSPLSFDKENIKNTIRTLKTSLLPKGSTDFNPVMNLLSEKLSITGRERAKVAVIFTDGEGHFAMNKSEIDKPKNAKIGIVFYGVGTIGGGKIPVFGGYKKNDLGEEIVTSLDVQTINEYAKATGGKYFILNNRQNELSKLVTAINQNVGSSVEINRHTVIYNKFVFFLLLALIFVGIDFLITIKVLKI